MTSAPPSPSSSVLKAPVQGQEPISAVPDIEVDPNGNGNGNGEETTTEIKKQKLFHDDVDVDGQKDGLQLNVQVGSQVKANHMNGENDNNNGNGSESEGVIATAVSPIPLVQEGRGQGRGEGEEQTKEEWFDLIMQWCGRTYPMSVGGNDMVYDFRVQIENLTKVPSENQKLIGLLPKSKSAGKGKLGNEFDALRFGTLGIKNNTKFVLVGTPEEGRFRDPTKVEGGVTDDFDVTYTDTAKSNKDKDKDEEMKVVSQADDPRNIRKVQEIIAKIPITVMNEPREGKRLLVLDLDYTIVDTRPLIDGALPSSECARPGLHEFLEQVYPHYDIVIWSQTHWRWLEAKLVELGMVGGNRNYKVSFVSDRTTMFPVFTTRNGESYKHEVKPLAYFWASFPQWSAKNTVHIDDLARNFALNPGEGLRIRAFKKAGQEEGMADRELWRLGSYLVNIANTVDDYTTLDHSNWKKITPRQ